MKEKDNLITVIIPVHELDDSTKPLFDIAILSVKNQTVRPDKVLIITPSGSETHEYLLKYDYGDLTDTLTVVANDGETDFQSQVTLGVNKCETEWFSVLEMDDEYSSIWFKNVYKYFTYYPNVDIFMPIIVDNDIDNNFLSFTNEAVWANSFSDELGVLDTESLLAYQNFNIDGMVMRVNKFKELGGFKKNIKLTFIYEFLLRMSHNSCVIMTIPKIGYKHMNQRPNSLFYNYKNTIDPMEAKWWLNKAKTEYFHMNDREITYN